MIKNQLALFSSAFQEDDYFEVYAKYFKDIVADDGPYDCPADYLGTACEAASLLDIPPISRRKLVDYYNDSGVNFAPYRRSLIDLISSWDMRDYRETEITACHSVTMGGMAVLAVLKDLGIRAVFFETPAYYATIYQARDLGLRFGLVPTYYRNDFTLEIPVDILEGYSPYAVWITQPRMALGLDQDFEAVKKLVASIGAENYLIIDEATEQRVPSTLHQIPRGEEMPRVIKIRSIMKGMGINGVRISVIIHPGHLKKDIEAALWLYQGGLDYASIEIVNSLTSQKQTLKTMLGISNEQTTGLRKRLETVTRHSRLTPIPLINGYISTLVADISHLGESFPRRRAALLNNLREERVVVTLGASMMFASHQDLEFIRCNYFLPEDRLTSSVLAILRAL